MLSRGVAATRASTRVLATLGGIRRADCWVNVALRPLSTMAAETTTGGAGAPHISKDPAGRTWQQTMLRIKDPAVSVPFYECVAMLACVSRALHCDTASTDTCIAWNAQEAFRVHEPMHDALSAVEVLCLLREWLAPWARTDCSGKHAHAGDDAVVTAVGSVQIGIPAPGKEWPAPETQEARDAFYKYEGVLIELTHNHGTESDDSFSVNNGNVEPHRGFGHIAVMTDDVYASCELLEANGCRFHKRPDEGRMKGLACASPPLLPALATLRNRCV